MFLLKVFVKSAHFKAIKKQKTDSQTAYVLTLHYTPPHTHAHTRTHTHTTLYASVRFWTDPPPPYLRTYFMDGPSREGVLLFFM